MMPMRELRQRHVMLRSTDRPAITNDIFVCRPEHRRAGEKRRLHGFQSRHVDVLLAVLFQSVPPER